MSIKNPNWIACDRLQKMWDPGVRNLLSYKTWKLKRESKFLPNQSTYHTFLRHSSCNELTEAVIWKTRAFFSLLDFFRSELIAKLSTKRFRKKFNLFCLLCLWRDVALIHGSILRLRALVHWIQYSLFLQYLYDLIYRHYLLEKEPKET